MGRAKLQASEITAYYVICKVGKSLKEYTTGLFYEDGCGVLALPIIIFHVDSLRPSSFTTRYHLPPEQYQ